jgi:hypothetical protein
LIRESYIRFGTEFATQLQHIDEAIRKAVQAPKGPADVRSPLAEHQRRPDS